jgi:hypothetical protein
LPPEAAMKCAMLVFASITLAACASQTELVSTWKEQGAARLDCSNTLVLFASKNATMRAVVEDRIAARIPNAVRARGVIDSRTSSDPVALKALLEAREFDCAVVVRFVALDSELEYVPGRAYSVPSGYRGFYNYYNYAWTTHYDPGYVTEKRTLVLDTNIYDIEADALVWAARSHTVDPDQADSVIDDLVDEVGAAMRKDGMLAK